MLTCWAEIEVSVLIRISSLRVYIFNSLNDDVIVIIAH